MDDTLLPAQCLYVQHQFEKQRIRNLAYLRFTL